MSTYPDQASRRQLALAGALAGFGASVAQSAIGFAIDRALLPREHDNNLSPRLINRTGGKVGVRTHPAVDWVLGALFHVGYGMGWGVLYAFARHTIRVPRLALGGGFGGVIYLLAFSPIGIGTHTGTEEHPSRRHPAKQIDLVAIPFAYSLPLVLLYDPIERRLRRSGADESADAPAETRQAVAE